jgi:hypothetical protein
VRPPIGRAQLRGVYAWPGADETLSRPLSVFAKVALVDASKIRWQGP